MRLKTRSLELVAATPETTRAEIADRRKLARLLRAGVPEDWPPPLNDEESMRYSLRFLEGAGREGKQEPSRVGWAHWYLLLPDPGESGRRLVGVAGFKGRPSSDGVAEIGYSILEDHQRRGLGTEAAEALIAWAFSHPEVSRVIAETLPELRPSIRVLERNGLRFLGSGAEEGAIRYGITRQEFQQRSG